MKLAGARAVALLPKVFWLAISSLAVSACWGGTLGPGLFIAPSSGPSSSRIEVLTPNPTGGVFAWQEVQVFLESDSIAERWETEIVRSGRRPRVVRQGFEHVIEHTCSRECSEHPTLLSGPPPQHVRVALLTHHSRNSLKWFREEAGKIGANAIILGAWRLTEIHSVAIYSSSLDVPRM